MSSYAEESMVSRAKWWLIGGGVLAAGVAAYLLWPASSGPAQPSAPVVAPAPGTPANALEEGIRSDLADFRQTGIAFTGVRLEDGRLLDYAPGTRIIYIRLGAGQRMLGLLEATNALGSRLFRRAFEAAPDIAAVYIDLVGPLADRYGHRYDAPWISYAMDRKTYAKIDWAGFDSGNLCEFLNHEQLYDSQSDTYCGTKGDL